VDLWTSRLHLFRKHYPPWKFALARWMIGVGMARKLRSPGIPQEICDAYRRILELARSK
jgi:hypothetical protein